MPAFMRCKLYLTDGADSWQEQYYATGSPSGAQCLAALSDLANARASFMASNCKVWKLWCSSDVVTGDSTDLFVNRVGQIKTAKDQLSQTCLKVRMDAQTEPAGLKRRTMYIDALPADSIKDVAGVALSPAVLTGFLAWKGLLLAAFLDKVTTPPPFGWGMKGVVPRATSKPGVKNTSQVVAAGVLTITTALPHGLFAGDKVKISGTTEKKTGKTLNYTWNVHQRISDVTYTVLAGVLANRAYTQLGYSNAVAYAVFPFARVTPLTYTSRPRGVTLGATRGRKRTRRVGS